MTIKKLLATAGAVALIATGAVIGAGPAQAAPSVTVTPNSNLKGGQTVTVTYEGYSPSSPIAVGVCPTSRIDKISGPGDCGRSKNGHSKLTTSDASGKGTAQITIPEGALGQANPPAEKCPPCSIGVTNIAKSTETANVALEYGGADPTPIATATGGTGGGNGGTGNNGRLVNTGPRETAITALIGFGLLQLGLVFAIRAHRSAPRRTIA